MPTFNEGDMLLVDSGDRNLSDGLWSVIVDECLYAKRIQVNAGKPFITLISDNDAYAPQNIDLAKDNFIAVGKIVMVFKKVS